MIKKGIYYCCFLVSFTLFAQEKAKTIVTSEVPVSIFTELMKDSEIATYKKPFATTLKLTNYKFLIFDQESIRNGNFSLDVRNIGRSASSYSYESYKNIDLYKYFPRIYDLRDIPWRQF